MKLDEYKDPRYEVKKHCEYYYIDSLRSISVTFLQSVYQIILPNIHDM